MNSKILLALGGLFLAACGSAKQHTPTWPCKTGGIPSLYEPVNIREVIRKHPELDGVVMLAPAYLERLERDMESGLKSRPPIDLSQRVDIGSHIAVRVYGESQLSDTYAVPAHGFIDVPLAGEVVVKGRTLLDIQNDITQRLKRYYLEPRVAVRPVESKRLSVGHVFVTGLAHGFHQKVVAEEESVIRFVQECGIRKSEDQRCILVLQRPDAARGRPRGRVIVVDMVAHGYGDWRQDFPLEPGDGVLMPPKTTVEDDSLWGTMAVLYGSSSQACMGGRGLVE
jgi:hypothetical protein